MQVDEELEGSIEEIGEELPENAPRYIVLSHALVSTEHGDRGSYRWQIHVALAKDVDWF
jgi:hypothetical protein